MSWFFSSQIHWGECLFFVASLEPHFHLHSLCLPNSPCLYVFASVWTFFYPERNLGFCSYDQFAIHLLEVIPRQCSLRTLPSSDASAKPWVARPSLVLQNFAILHCQSESTWNTFVGAISKMFFLPMKYTFSALERSEPVWKHINSDKSSRSTLNPPGLHVARALRTTQWTDGDPKGGTIICGVFVFRSPTSLGWKKNANFYTTGSQTSWKTSPLAIQEILQVLRDVSWNKELVVLFFSSIWNRLGDVDFMQTPIHKFKEVGILREFFGSLSLFNFVFNTHGSVEVLTNPIRQGATDRISRPGAKEVLCCDEPGALRRPGDPIIQWFGVANFLRHGWISSDGHDVYFS